MSKLERDFLVFHATNPHVYDKFVELARLAKRRGYHRWSANGIFERLRWFYAFETVGDPFKLNNNFRAYYARLAMGREPDLQGFFAVRRTRS